MNWRVLFFVVALFANCAPAFAATCTAKIKSGKSPYAHIKTNQNIDFWSFSLEGVNSERNLIGDRMLMIPVRDLYDISPGCAKLKEYKESY